ncbi:MAG TPA: DNA polymerase III subunit beta [Mycobacteriales bacterium]|jgi:DNA polymerase-3 subunit beta|nr:DNA polymerase III subunit beta [Mycobacteriales bacterium]
MKFQIERDVLADAVAWTAKALPQRPPVPVLGGVLLALDGSRLSVSGFDYEVSTQVDLEVQATTAGRTLVSGRLLADITRALPAHPVDISVEGPRVLISCGNAKFSLPTMPVEDYPTLPQMPTAVGTVASDVFASAVAQVAIAAGRDDTLPMLTGVRLEIEGERLTLAATDRYRLAVRELGWKPEKPGLSHAVLVPARTLLDAARTLTSGPELTLALSSADAGEGMMGFGGTGRRTTTRLLDAEFPKYQSLWPASYSARSEIPTPMFIEAVKRVALVADRGTPVRLEFAEGGATLSAGGDDEGRAEEQIPITFDGDPITIAFNPTFLLDGLNAIDSDVARISFTESSKPAVLSGKAVGDDDTDGTTDGVDYRYLIMPVRLPG